VHQLVPEHPQPLEDRLQDGPRVSSVEPEHHRLNLLMQGALVLPGRVQPELVVKEAVLNQVEDGKLVLERQVAQLSRIIDLTDGREEPTERFPVAPGPLVLVQPPVQGIEADPTSDELVLGILSLLGALEPGECRPLSRAVRV